MVAVGAPKKELTERTRLALERAAAKRDAAEDALWQLCAAALEEGTYEEISPIVGVAKSTLQARVREARERDA